MWKTWAEIFKSWITALIHIVHMLLVRLCVCACTCVWVRERERERERGLSGSDYNWFKIQAWMLIMLKKKRPWERQRLHLNNFLFVYYCIFRECEGRSLTAKLCYAAIISTLILSKPIKGTILRILNQERSQVVLNEPFWETTWLITKSR